MSNERSHMIHLMFLSFYQYMGPLEQEAREGLDPAVMELVLVAMVLVQEVMVQDLEDTGLAQVAMVLGLVDMELEAMEAEALVVVLGLLVPLESELEV